MSLLKRKGKKKVKKLRTKKGKTQIPVNTSYELANTEGAKLKLIKLENKEYKLIDSQIEAKNQFWGSSNVNKTERSFEEIDMRSIDMDLDQSYDESDLEFSKRDIPHSNVKKFNLNDIYSEDQSQYSKKEISHINPNEKYTDLNSPLKIRKRITFEESKENPKKHQSSSKSVLKKISKYQGGNPNELNIQNVENLAEVMNNKNLVLIEKAREVLLKVIFNKN